MSWGLALGGLGALASGLGSFFGGQQQARAYQRAADTSAALAREAMALQEPWRQAGLAALPVLQREVGTEFQASPGYNWLLRQALAATDRDAASRGLFYSGARAQALQDRAIGLANQDYSNWFNRLAMLAGFGPAATSNMSGALGAAIPTITGAIGNAGSAGGASIAGLGQQFGGLGNNLLTIYAMGRMRRNLDPLGVE